MQVLHRNTAGETAATLPIGKAFCGQTARSFYLQKGRSLHPHVKVPKTSSLYCLVPKHQRDMGTKFLTGHLKLFSFI